MIDIKTAGSVSKLFYSDKGKEFYDRLIDESLTEFGIKRSLSRKGCMPDNAATAERTYETVTCYF